MTTIRIPYAVGNLGTFVFQEISYSEYVKYSQAISKLQNIYQQKYSGEVNISAELARLRNDLRKKHIQTEPLYVAAKQRLEDFKKRHRSILIKGELLEDAEGHEKLSWIFSFSSKEADLARHYEKYKHIYEQLRVLRGEVRKLEPYSKEFIRETMSQEEGKARYSLEYRNEINLERWHKQRDEDIRDVNRILAPVRMYSTLIRNLTVTTNGTICDVSCTALPMYGGRQQTVRQTLINRTAQIIR